MRTFVRILAMMTFLVCPPAFAGGADEAGPSRTQSVVKPSNTKATAELVVAHGTNTGKGIDPKLARHKELKSPPFSSYDSYSMLQEASEVLELKRPTALKLPEGRELTIQLDKVEEKGGKPIRFTVTATIKKAGGEESTVQVKARPNVMFFVAGQRYKGGILVLGMRVR